MSERATLLEMIRTEDDPAKQKALSTRLMALEEQDYSLEELALPSYDSITRTRGPQGPRGPQGGDAIVEMARPKPTEATAPQDPAEPGTGPLPKQEENLGSDIRAYMRDDINEGQLLNRATGSAMGAVVDPIVGMLNNSDLMSKWVLPMMARAQEKDIENLVPEDVTQFVTQLRKDDPEVARDLDMLANTVELLPGGWAKRAGRNMTTYGSSNPLGGAIASFSNYIKHYYNPERGPNATEVQRAEDISTATRGAVPFPALTGGQIQSTGIAQHGGKSIEAMLSHLFDPESKALYGEQLLTRPAQRNITEHLDNDAAADQVRTVFDPKTGLAMRDKDGTVLKKDETRGEAKAVSQVHYTSDYIPRQTEGTPKGTPGRAATEVLKRSFISDPQPYNKGTLAKELSGMEYLRDTGNRNRPANMKHNDKGWQDTKTETLDPATSAQVVDFIERSLGGKIDHMAVKHPTSIQSGGHFNDVVVGNPANATLRQNFGKLMDKDGNVDITALREALVKDREKSVADLKKNNRKRDTWNVVDMGDGNLWLAGSKGGSAVTEGGVGWLTKVEKDGNMTTFMYDRHDHAEKIPGVQLAVPDTLVAVSPPMVSNLKNTGKTKNLKGQRGDHFQQVRGRESTDDTMKGLLREVASEDPILRNIEGEKLKQKGVYGMLGLPALSEATNQDD